METGNLVRKELAIAYYPIQQAAFLVLDSKIIYIDLWWYVHDYFWRLVDIQNKDMVWKQVTQYTRN